MMLSLVAGGYPLYQVGNWLKDVARNVLRGQELDAEHFHDTRLATALDAIYQAGPLRIFSDLVLHAIDYYQIQTQGLHGDTTSVSVYSDYAQGRPRGVTTAVRPFQRPPSGPEATDFRTGS